MIELSSMKRRIPDRLCLGFFLTLIVSTFSVPAQQAPPTLKSVVPHGGQRGSTVSLFLDGTNLGSTRRIRFERSGFEASIVERDALPNVQELEEGETRPLILDKSTKDRLTLQVRMDPDLRPGVYSFRLETALGVTNALPFAVGPFPEVEETQVNNRLDQAQEVQVEVRCDDAEHLGEGGLVERCLEVQVAKDAKVEAAGEHEVVGALVVESDR